MIDRLAAPLGHFSVSARTFQSDPLCGINTLDGSDPYGQLHLVKEGAVEVWHGNTVEYRISEPGLLFYPRPTSHRFVTDPSAVQILYVLILPLKVARRTPSQMHCLFLFIYRFPGCPTASPC